MYSNDDGNAEDSMMSRLRAYKREIGLAALVPGIIGVGTYYSWRNHRNFRRLVVNQSQEQMMETAIAARLGFEAIICNDEELATDGDMFLKRFYGDNPRTDAYVWIADSAGMIIAHPDSSIVGKNLNEITSSLSLASMASAEGGSRGIYTLNGVPSLTSGFKITNEKGDFYLMASMPYSIIERPIKANAMSTLGIAGMIMAFMALSAIALYGESRKKAVLETENKHLEERVKLVDTLQKYEEKLSKSKDIQKSLYESISEIFAAESEQEGRIECAGHILRIKEYTKLTAEILSKTERYAGYIDEDYVFDVGVASMLHDVGKGCISDEILLKTGKLSENEWIVMKLHPIYGLDKMDPLFERVENSYSDLVKCVIRHHHERWDGKGYVDCLAGETIPLSARIVSISDVYDALTQDRCYRKALPHEKAVEIMMSSTGQFDPFLLETFEKNNKRYDEIRKRMTYAGL